MNTEVSMVTMQPAWVRHPRHIFICPFLSLRTYVSRKERDTINWFALVIFHMVENNHNHPSNTAKSLRRYEVWGKENHAIRERTTSILKNKEKQRKQRIDRMLPNSFKKAIPSKVFKEISCSNFESLPLK